MTRQTLQSLCRDVVIQGLLATLALAAVAVLSLPAARGAGPIGAMPLWLLVLPTVALITALALRWPASPGQLPAMAVARRRRPAAVPRRALRPARREARTRAA